MRKSSTAIASRVASFPIVGIGASAGGLEAISEFLKTLPGKNGMAIVVIQHLSPHHDSALVQILSKLTSMPVNEAADGVVLRQNHVYVIPPNKGLSLHHGTLKFTSREGASVPYHPIDEFYLSLAHEQKTRGIGVILSGSGSDGTLGLRAIKTEGGVTFAQDPQSAGWTAMPMSAIAADAADFILTPKEIAHELVRISTHPYVLEREKTAQRKIPEGNELEKIYLFLRSVVGVDFRLYKQPSIARRIARRMALRKIETLNEYAKFLRQHIEECNTLVDDIFIHVTEFFRDAECFQSLRKRLIPKLHRRLEPIRVWVPGCSSGEEAYSLAILLIESLEIKTKTKPKIQIYGTDISEASIQRARTGIYSESAVRGLSSARLKRFFLKVEHGYQINKEVRAVCVFARHDLATDPPFSKLDLVSCRNVLIYAGPLLQNRILAALQYALKPGGFLFLGKAEAISGYSDMFVSEDRHTKIFSRNPSASTAPYFDWRNEKLGLFKEPPLFTPPTVDFRKEAEQIILQRYSLPALVINSDLRVLHFQGDISPYLVFSSGPPTISLLKILRPEFIVNLRSAISKMNQEKSVVSEPIHFTHNGYSKVVQLEILPLKKSNGVKPDLLVIFKEITIQSANGKKEQVQLERELATTREYLTSLISEYETAKEEMKAAHEEVFSSNEELQSTNEELETAKEELESSNEELLTLNEELLHRNLDLGVLSNDLNNLLVGVDIPVVVLDGNLHIRRFTPMAGKLLNLLNTDVGRPFSNLASSLKVDWSSLFAEVISQSRPLEREVEDYTGYWHSLRIRPYRTNDNKIDGLIVVLLDTDVINRELKESERLSATYRVEIHALAAKLITAQEDERRRVSRELHDSLCQQLVSLALDIENLAITLPVDFRNRLQGLGDRVVRVSEEARNIAYELHPSVLDDLGLVVSLQAMCDEFSKNENVQVDFNYDHLPGQISQKMGSGLYRIAQESMQNVAKHAKAKHLGVFLKMEGQNLILVIKDDGVGFNLGAVKGKGGLGLVGIGERVRILEGTLSIQSNPKGTEISVRVPAQDRTDDNRPVANHTSR